MRELDALKITAAKLEPSCEVTLVSEHPHPEAVLLSHFEVTELVPVVGLVELTDLRIEQLSYLVVPVLLTLLGHEQQHARRRAEQQELWRMRTLLPLLEPRRLLQLVKQDRRVTRLMSLDVVWRPRQRLAVTLKNFGTTAASASIELVLYALGDSLLVVN